MVKNITDSELHQAVATGFHLVDLWAPWCGPCKMQSPMLDKLDVKYNNDLVLKLNIDENPDAQKEFGVMSIPTMLIFKDGELVDTLTGFHPLTQLEAALAKVA